MVVQTCVPYLDLDYFGVNFHDSGGDIHSNGGLNPQVELIAGEARKEIGLAHT